MAVVVVIVLMATGRHDSPDKKSPAGSGSSGPSPSRSLGIPTALPSELPSRLPSKLPSELPSGIPSGLEPLIPSLGDVDLP
ncbi:hypothetical protein ABZZ74_32345 [Streptomyces sp. NPDC006476]|uniref:hypothetical protein n=1 Tax=Streptomyces sp. NPDC006476 TaxID=3157175 RepID=UPI0033BE2D58